MDHLFVFRCLSLSPFFEEAAIIQKGASPLTTLKGTGRIFPNGDGYCFANWTVDLYPSVPTVSCRFMNASGDSALSINVSNDPIGQTIEFLPTYDTPNELVFSLVGASGLFSANYFSVINSSKRGGILYAGPVENIDSRVLIGSTAAYHVFGGTDMVCRRSAIIISWNSVLAI